MSSTDVSPSATPSTTPLSGTNAPKFGTVIPNRIFVGGIAANTTDAELKQFFAAHGAVKDTKIIADRAGVSKGYGFVTFENQEDADRIIKKEADNLVFRDRKLNIGPAVRKQVLPRSYDSNIQAGTVMFANGVPYTYQNGMAIYHASEGGYPVPQPQPTYASNPYSAAVMVPQTPTIYMTPSYQTAAANAYQSAAAYQTAAYHQSTYQPTPTPQWTTSPQWRWGPQSPSQPTALGGSPGYVYATMHTPELMYAQPPPSGMQPGDLDALQEATAVEVIPGHYAM